MLDIPLSIYFSDKEHSLKHQIKEHTVNQFVSDKEHSLKHQIKEHTVNQFVSLIELKM